MLCMCAINRQFHTIGHQKCSSKRRVARSETADADACVGKLCQLLKIATEKWYRGIAAIHVSLATLNCIRKMLIKSVVICLAAKLASYTLYAVLCYRFYEESILAREIVQSFYCAYSPAMKTPTHTFSSQMHLECAYRLLLCRIQKHMFRAQIRPYTNIRSFASEFV